MKKRQLGKTDIKISEVGLGTWQLSGDVWGQKTEAEYIQAIEVAFTRAARGLAADDF